MLDVEISKNLFKQYTAEATSININLTNFKSALKYLGNDLISCVLDNETHRIQLSNGKRIIELPQLTNTIGNADKKPELDYSDGVQDIEIKTSEFKENLKGIKLCAESGNLLLENGNLRIIAISENKIFKSKVAVEGSLLQYTDKKISSKYSLEYLEKIPATENSIKFSFKSDYPMTATTKGTGYKIVMILAPRVDVE